MINTIDASNHHSIPEENGYTAATRKEYDKGSVAFPGIVTTDYQLVRDVLEMYSFGIPFHLKIIRKEQTSTDTMGYGSQ